MKNIQIKIFGSVFGVGFRWSAYEKFVELGIQGNAENNKDGFVQITAEGDESQLQKLIEWCHQGPVGAKVEKVEETEIPLRILPAKPVN